MLLSMKKKSKNLLRDIIRFFLPARWYIKVRFFIEHNYFLNLKNPHSFNEKIQFRKLNCNADYFSQFVDKFAVRKYVEEIIGSDFITI